MMFWSRRDALLGARVAEDACMMGSLYRVTVA